MEDGGVQGGLTAGDTTTGPESGVQVAVQRHAAFLFFSALTTQFSEGIAECRIAVTNVNRLYSPSPGVQYFWSLFLLDYGSRGSIHL